MGEAKDFYTAVQQLRGSVREDKENNTLHIAYSTFEHHKEITYPNTPEGREKAIRWLETLYGKLYDPAREEELENEAMLESKLSRED